MNQVLDKEKILEHWNDTKDQPEDLSGNMKWADMEGSSGYMPYEHSRPMSSGAARKGLARVKKLTDGYPVQLRYAMALPLWYRYCETWCDTGSVKKALEAI